MAPYRVASISTSSQSAKSTAMCGALGPLLRDEVPEDRKTLGLEEDETILPPDAVSKEVPVPGLLVEAVSNIQGEQVVLEVDSLGLTFPKAVAVQQGGRGGGMGGGGSEFHLSAARGGGGVGTRPWWLALLACGGAYWPLALEPSAMTRRHPHYCRHPHCRGHPPSWVRIQNATSAHGVLP